MRISIAVFVLCCGAAASAQPFKGDFSPPPPGSVVDRRLVAFNGEKVADRWSALLSRKRVGSGNARDYYQWYLSIYALQRGAYRLRYQSPGNGAPLARVEQARGAAMWFPVQDVRIVGIATLMHRGVQQLVIDSHEMAADCGAASVTIFATKAGGGVGPVAAVTNPCALDARIASEGNALELRGPYYAANAPLCCPTKPRATATLRYRNGKWVETPSYFKVE